MTICPKCGKPGFKGLCPDCAPNPIISKLKDLKLVYCPRSREAKIENKWVEAETLDDAIGLLLEAKMEAKRGANIGFTYPSEEISQEPGIIRKVPLQIVARHRGREETIEVPIIFEFVLNPRLSKKGTDYFEGVLQVRHYQPDHHKHIIDYIRNEISKQADKGGFLNDVEEIDGGMDFMVTNQNLLPSLARKVVREFGGEVKITAKLYTLDKQTSHEVFRSVVRINLPEFLNGEVLEINHQLYKVLSSKDRRFSCIRLRDLAKDTFETNKQRFEIVARKEDIRKTRVTQVHPRLEIMHPETYQNVPVENLKLPKEYVVDEYVSVIEHKKAFWIVK